MLPKLSHPSYEVKIPSNKKIYKFRPYTVKEQKILLMMQDSDSIEDLTRCITDLIESCSLTPISTDELTYFDIEYLFLKIRSKSVGESSTVSYKCNNQIDGELCNTVNELEISLDDVEVSFENSIPGEIKLTEDIFIKLKYPNAKSAKALELYNVTKDIDYLTEAINEDLESIMDSEKIYDDFTQEELKEFLNSLDLTVFKNILQFYINTPRLTKNVQFKCRKCNYSETIILSGLSDFFV
jgi:superfamily II RNA helicase